MDLGLSGTHALVTGANGGIGLATVEAYLSAGANVTAHYRSSDTNLKSLLDQHKDRLRTAQGDLTKEDEVANIFTTAAKAFGPVEIAVVNHGVWPTTHVPVQQMSLERWNDTISQDLTSPFLVCRAYLDQLAKVPDSHKDNAAIVFVGSTAGKFGEAGHADYAACKSALMYGLTRSLKNEIVKIAPKGRVNCIAPGWVRTPMAEDALKDPKVVHQALATTPLKKVAEPADVARQIVLVSSPVVSGHVTGQVVMVDGGMEGRLLNRAEDIAP